ncbi:MAG: GGDEF domain-containing protein [Fusobacteriaceae bacterium]
MFFSVVPKEYFGITKNFMISIGSGIAVLIFYHTYKKNSFMKKYYLALLATGFFYLVGNFLWLIFNVTLEEKGGFFGNIPLFIAAKVSLAFAVYFLMESSLKKWDGIKIFLDGFILGLMLFYVAWAIIYNNIVTYLLFDNFQSTEKLYFLSSLVINFLMFFGLVIFYLFNKSYLKIKNNILEACGFLLWFIADLSLLYLQLYRDYEPIHIVNAIWMISLLFLALSALTPKKENQIVDTLEELGLYNSKNIAFNCLIVFLGIVLFIMAPITFLVILPILIFRIIFSKYVRVSRYNVILIENANLDPLTKLFNRKKFTEEMKKIFKNPEKRGVMMILQINRFKYINNFYGYLLGDKVLMEMGERIRGILDEDIISAKWNGDELILYIKNISNRDEAYLKCKEILDLLKKPFQYKTQEITCSINIGGALCPEDSIELEELIKLADSSLIRACREGKNKIFLFQKNIGLEEEYREL